MYEERKSVLKEKKSAPLGFKEAAVRAGPRERLGTDFPVREEVLLVFVLGAVVVVQVHLVLVCADDKAQRDTAQRDVLPQFGTLWGRQNVDKHTAQYRAHMQHHRTQQQQDAAAKSEPAP